MSDGYQWIDLGDGRSVCRKVDNGPPPARSALGFPMIGGKAQDPGGFVREEFVPAPPRDGRETRDHLRKTLNDIRYGNVPPEQLRPVELKD